MVAVMIVVGDEALDAGVEITRQEVVLQQDAVLEGLMPAFDLALRLRVVGRTSDMIHAVIIEPFGEFTRDVSWRRCQIAVVVCAGP